MNDDNLKVVKNEEKREITPELIGENVKKLEIDKKSIEKKIENDQQELSEKVFVIGDDIEEAKIFLEFLNRYAEWSYAEAQILTLTYESIKNVVEQMNKSDEFNFVLKFREIQAIKYFLQKYKGQGIKDAKKISRVLGIIGRVWSDVEPQLKKLEELQNEIKRIDYKIESWKHGMQPVSDLENVNKPESLTDKSYVK